MKKSYIGSIFACTGAVIGAGFASGREIVSFFTDYGRYSWWLIGLTAIVTGALCWLVLRHSTASKEDWCSLFISEPNWMQTAVRICAVSMMLLTGGAMISAGGHMVALVWDHPFADEIGAAGTLTAAWAACICSVGPLSWMSAVLALFFLGTAGAVWRFVPISQTAALLSGRTTFDVVHAAVNAVGYAAMNLTLAIGIINRCRQKEREQNVYLCIGFATMIFLLLSIGNAVFSRFPECRDAPFPMVYLLRSLGKTGYLAGAVLLYLAILTTLTAILYAVRTALEPLIVSKKLAAFCSLTIPLAVSFIGFTGIIDRLYAPAGLACLLVVFVPLLRRNA